MSTFLQKRFFLNRFIIFVYFLWIFEGLILSIHSWNECPQNLMNLVLIAAFAIALIVIIFYFYSSFKEYIVITPSGIKHKQQFFPWSNIMAISLSQSRHERNGIPRLVLGLTYGTTHKIGLKMLTDSNRRALLNCIKNYKSIAYDKTKYESNYMTWTMAIMITLFIYINIMLLSDTNILSQL